MQITIAALPGDASTRRESIERPIALARRGVVHVVHMSGALAPLIVALSSTDATARRSAAAEIYKFGRALVEPAVWGWWENAELSALLRAPKPEVTIGLAVERDTFSRIHRANGAPRLAEVPADQDAEEFELCFPGGISLDVLTSREPGGTGAIAKYLRKFAQGIQQVEFRCDDVDRATAILQHKFGIRAVYPQTRPGADGTRVNFFLLSLPSTSKVLVELYQRSEGLG